MSTTRVGGASKSTAAVPSFSPITTRRDPNIIPLQAAGSLRRPSEDSLTRPTRLDMYRDKGRSGAAHNPAERPGDLRLPEIGRHEIERAPTAPLRGSEVKG